MSLHTELAIARRRLSASVMLSQCARVYTSNPTSPQSEVLIESARSYALGVQEESAIWGGKDHCRGW